MSFSKKVVTTYSKSLFQSTKEVKECELFNIMLLGLRCEFLNITAAVPIPLTTIPCSPSKLNLLVNGGYNLLT